MWNTPTVDAKRGLIYVGTGNNFGRIPAATSDSILALRMTDGAMVWHHQEFERDTFMARCQAANPADSNCPDKLGPDYDFGGSSAILQTINGKDILLAAGKGGVAIASIPTTKVSFCGGPNCGRTKPLRLPVWWFGVEQPTAVMFITHCSKRAAA